MSTTIESGTAPGTDGTHGHLGDETSTGGNLPAKALQAFLPRFSDPKDIAEFVEKLEAFERGDLTSDQFRTFRLLRGVYGQRQEGTQMFRVKIPFGRLFPTQLDALADVADRWSRGYGHVTTRQNVQFHFVNLSDTEAVMRHLDEVGLTSRDACGNAVRTVTACETAQVCSTAAFDVTPYAEAMTRMFLRHPLSGTLPRKFKIAFSGCERDCAFGAIHDLGFIAAIKDGEKGFKVLCAGGLSTSPQNAITLHEFVRAGEISRVGETVLRIFHAMGNRENKARARLKYVLRKLGEPAFRAKYAEVRAQVDGEALAELEEAVQPAATPAPPVLEAEGTPRAEGYLKWRSASVLDQKQAGYAAVYVRLALGDITSAQLRGMAKVAAHYGDGSVRFTIDQNLLLPWVDQRSLPALFRALSELGLAKLDLHTARDVTSCPGAETCNLAVTASRSLAGEIANRLEKTDAYGLAAVQGTVIKISGCPNSCGQHHIADIGFHGGAKTVNGVTVPMYQLHLGGGVDERGARFGRQVVKIIARRVPDAVVELLKLYESDRTSDAETPGAFFQRVDAKKVNAALAEYLVAPVTGDEADIGETQGFALHTGAGECAA